MTEYVYIDRALELRTLSKKLGSAALRPALSAQELMLDGAEAVAAYAAALERKAAPSKQEAIQTISPDATEDELYSSRIRTATRRGTDIFLPNLPTKGQVFPNTLLRSALFAAGRRVQSLNEQVITGKTDSRVINKTIETLSNVTIVLTGYELCQFDRQVYAACLSYYNDQPLHPDPARKPTTTSFYLLAKRMGSQYSANLHRSLWASLMRLSNANLRVRLDGQTIEIPTLLAVSFESDQTECLSKTVKGSDKINLSVMESIAELFGRGRWLPMNSKTLGYDGLHGWVTCFYATHSKEQWLNVEKLYRLSGYESHIRNFKNGLRSSLEKLISEARIARYSFATKEGQQEEQLIVYPVKKTRKTT